MDRRLLAAGLTLTIVCGACSKSKPDGAAAPPRVATQSAALPPAAATSEPAAAEPVEQSVTVTMNGRASVPPQRMEIRFDAEAAPDAAPPASAAPPIGPSVAPTERQFPVPAAEPRVARSAENPLRDESEAVADSSRSGNPLRTFPEAPVFPGASAPNLAGPGAAAPGVSLPASAVPGSQPPRLDEMLAAPLQSPAGGSSASSEAVAAQGDPIRAEVKAQGAANLGAGSSSPFDEVEVFYGTDRQSTERESSTWSGLAVRLLPACLSGLMTLALGLVAVAKRSFGVALLSVVGVGATTGLGLQASTGVLAAVRQSGTEGPHYTGERSSGGRVELGICKVTIPRSHQIGEVESPSITRLEIRPDARRHVVLQKTQRLLDEAYFDLLRKRTQASPRKELFVFIHGFNVPFDDAARRTAQIHYDLKFEGAPIFFSWPANNKFVLTYAADESNVAWSVPHLKQFLLSIVAESSAQSINLIAHSMGNRALTAALREIDLEMRDQTKLFNQVILAAPDIDADEFRTSIAPAMQRSARQFTLYASARDDALLASQFVHRGPRAGDAGNGLVVVPGIDTIDVTAIDSSPWGHSYYGSSDPVLNDLRTLFTGAIPAKERSWLTPAQSGELTYWIFQPTRTATTTTQFNRQ